MQSRVIEVIDKQFYMEVCKMIDRNLLRLQKNNIIIFGAGIMGIEVSYVLREYGLLVFAFSDNDANKWGDTWGEVKIISPNELGKEKTVVILAMENYRKCQEQLEEMGFVLGTNLLVVSKKIKSRYLEDFRIKNDMQSLILGDCMMGNVSLLEREKESLTEKFSADSTVKVLAKNNVYMRFYYHVFKLLLNDMKNLRKVILEFSVDMFGNKYHLLPANQQVDIWESLCDMSNKDNEETENFLNVMREREKNQLLDNSKVNRGSMSEEIRIQGIKNHFKMNYMFTIKEDNESMVYLSDFLKLCREYNIECISIIMPVNYEIGIHFFQNEFIDKYENNKRIICDCIQRNKGFVIDMSYQLRGGDFISIYSSNEGIYAEGRSAIYERVRNFL